MSARAPSAESTISLDSGKMKLVFDASGDTVKLKSITQPGGREWLSEFNEKCVLWTIALTGPDGATKQVTSRAARFIGANTTTRGASFEWSADLDGKQATITMRVRLPRGSNLSYWSMHVDLPEGWQVTRTDFPLVANVGIGSGLKVAVPMGWGIEHDMSPSVEWRGTYPSLWSAMQFVCFYGDGKGLYVGVHDAEANHKTLAVKGREDGVGFTCTNFPARAEPPVRAYRVPGEAVIGVFEGDYWNGAQIYRDFTFKTPWGKAGPVSKRPIPQWLKDTEVWLRPGERPLTNTELTKRAAEFLGTPVSLHWYNWHQIPFDTLYPEYFPAKPHFEQGVKALQLAGLRVTPYINGRLCDPKSKTWTDEGGEKAAARKENGEPYTEVYGSKVPLNAMCPYTDQWQKKMVGIVDKLANECGVDGVYIDQICAAHAVQCFDASHGHPVGGGRFWVDGYRKMLDLARSKLPKDRVLTTEENAECWIDQFDALLMVNTPSGRGRVIPLFPAVYSGRMIVFGFQYFTADDMAKSLPFRVKTAQAFVYGSQLGWIRAEWIMAPEAVNDAELLRDLARCRRFGHKFLVYGRFLGILDAGGNNPALSCEAKPMFGDSCRIETPAVVASAWLAEDGSLGIALVNVSDEERGVDIVLPLKAARLRPKGLVMRIYGPEGETGRVQVASPDQTVKVPARSGLILCVEGK